jgi:hypothetical protein
MYLVILILMIIVILLLLSVYFRLSRGSDEPFAAEAVQPEKPAKLTPCPLCKTLLKPGERVHSVVYPGKGDRLVEIYGCPYCYPPNSSYPRYCPSCKREIGQDELIFARQFDSAGKVHVHVNGCKSCMRRA